jgi:mRNA interferase RelE/StbE
MKTLFRKSFARDLKKIDDQRVLERVKQVIEAVEAADDIRAIDGLKRLRGTSNCYRIRVSDHRIGVVIQEARVEFVRCLPRRDLYRSFP